MRLRITFLILFPVLIVCQARQNPLPIEIRQRVIDDRKLMVIVDIQNETGKMIVRMEGFLYAKTLSGKIEPERHLVFIAPYESLSSGSSHNETELFSFDPMDPWDFRFQISRLEFRDDPRIYTYHPEVGFIRIE